MDKKALFTSLLVVCALLVPALGENVIHLDAAKAAQVLSNHPDIQVIDVRTSDEFNEVHIDKAKNIDFQEANFETEVAKLDRDKPYLIHCASGGRSSAALDVFKQLGFKRIHHLDGGIKAWIKAGQPVVK
jgi:phage shock protein E